MDLVEPSRMVVPVVHFLHVDCLVWSWYSPLGHFRHVFVVASYLYPAAQSTDEQNKNKYHTVKPFITTHIYIHTSAV